MTSTHIVDYHVVTCVNIDNLLTEVNSAISLGWQPIGGMISTAHPTGGYLEIGPAGEGIKGPIMFSQTLVKYASTVGLMGPG